MDIKSFLCKYYIKNTVNDYKVKFEANTAKPRASEIIKLDYEQRYRQCKDKIMCHAFKMANQRHPFQMDQFRPKTRLNCFLCLSTM